MSDVFKLVQNRLSMIICPEIGSEADGSQPVLKGFLSEMPVDMIFEIASYLYPRDLLNLSRSSKHVRSVFLHRSSLGVWKRVLRRGRLPECPNDLTEPQYTSLMFDTNVCMACRATPDKIICDFGLRLRLCSTCWEVNVVRGMSFYPSVGATGTAFTLIPARDWKTLSSSWKNNALKYYFKPELEAAMIEEKHRYKSMSPKEYYKWVDERRAAATRMLQEGIVLERWYREWHAADKRSRKMRNEMDKLGWNNAFFPRPLSRSPSPVAGITSDQSPLAPRFSNDYLIWNHLMVGDGSELDEDGLAKVMRNLSSIYCRRREEFFINEVKEYYLNNRNRLPMEKFVCVPGWKDVSSYRCIEQFIQGRTDKHTTGHLEVLMEKIVDEGKKTFVPQFEAVLVDVVKVCDPSQCRISKKRPCKKKKKISKKRIMGRAINLFLCTCPVCVQKLISDGIRKVYGYPEVVGHIATFVSTEDHWFKQTPSTDIILIQSARDVLKALGLAKNSTREEVKDFCCGCGHSRCETPIDFERLVEHVYNQRFWTAEMRKRANSTWSKELLDTLLFEGHTQCNLASLGVIIRALNRSASE